VDPDHEGIVNMFGQPALAMSCEFRAKLELALGQSANTAAALTQRESGKGKLGIFCDPKLFPSGNWGLLHDLVQPIIRPSW
jgi:hypothetical protein